MSERAEAESLAREMAASRERLMRAIAGVGEEQFKRRPPAAAGEEQPWCIAEVLAHLMASERLYAARIDLALREDGVAAPQRTPQQRLEEARSGRAAPVPQLIHGLLAARRELERLLQRAGSLPDGLQRGVSIGGVRESVGEMLRRGVIEHEREHATQIERLRAATGAPPPA